MGDDNTLPHEFLLSTLSRGRCLDTPPAQGLRAMAGQARQTLMPVEAGMKIGVYEVTGHLGSGGMGEVYPTVAVYA